MGRATNDITIDREPDAVWAVVRDYHALDTWMPGVESCRGDGDDRVIAMMGMEIRERLVRRDDSTRTLVYGIVDSPMVQRHEATITVAPEGTGSHVTWNVEVEPDAMVEVMGAVYRQSLEALRDHVEA